MLSFSFVCLLRLSMGFYEFNRWLWAASPVIEYMECPIEEPTKSILDSPFTDHDRLQLVLSRDGCSTLDSQSLCHEAIRLQSGQFLLQPLQSE